MAATFGEDRRCVGLSAAQVATLSERWPSPERTRCSLSLSACVVATPSSVPSTATPSDVGSLHEEPLRSEDVVEMREVPELDDMFADSDSGMPSPSKSFRRRLRRKRQAEAMKAGAAATPIAATTEAAVAYSESDSRPCPRPRVTLEDLGFGLLSPCGGLVDGNLMLQSASATPIGIHQYRAMNMVASAQAHQASFCGGAITPARPTPLEHSVTPLSACIVSTSPCLGTVVRGDASCRTPVVSVAPAVGLSNIVVATPTPIQCCTTISAPPVDSTSVGFPAVALRFLCGGSTPTSAEELAQRLQASAPDVYHD
jgi:hypothetical protein